MPKIYFDHNATAPFTPTVKASLQEAEEACFGNPSSVHWAGREAKRFLNASREKIAALLGAEEREILFTSGGTESINTALVGLWESRTQASKIEIITSPIEHHATLKTLEYLAERGTQVTYLSVDRKGRIDPEELKERIGPLTLLVSLLYAHNELGNLSPVEEVGRLCRENGVLFHCDGVQAVGKARIDLKALPIDLFSFSAHKFHGPKGVGGLYVREGVSLAPLHRGGMQERSLRGGTENVPAIHAASVALEEAMRDFEADQRKIAFLRERLEKGLLSRNDNLLLNGDLENRLANTTNVLVRGVDGESLLINLDLEGVAASAGAACESGSIDPSHVLLAMGFSPEEAKASIRFSLSKLNTEGEVDEVVESFTKVVKRLRKI
ncbi:MAG: cysteine desulfurase family protein [bacterium]